MSNRYCCLLASLQCVLQYVQSLTPDEGRKDRPKHIECYSNKINLRHCYIWLVLLYRFFFFFHWHYSPLWALVFRTMSFHFFLSATNSLHLLTPSTWRYLSTPSFHLFLGLPLLLVPSSSWVKIFLGILSSSILSRWPNQLILFTIQIVHGNNCQ